MFMHVYTLLAVSNILAIVYYQTIRKIKTLKSLFSDEDYSVMKSDLDPQSQNKLSLQL